MGKSVSDAQLIQTIYLVGGTSFLAALFLGVVTTGARVLFYVRRHRKRPRLLNRDITVKGLLALSFGLIVLIRFLPADVRPQITGTVAWALATTIPAVLAMLVYDWYELFVIGRAT